MKFRLTFLVGVLLVLLAACAPADPTETTPTEEPQPTATEAEAEPTEAPTAEPTSEPTAEPTAEPTEEPAPQPAVTINNQLISEEGTITVASVTSDGPGWLVIHADEDGVPGPVIGQAQVEPGETTNVVVPVDPTAATNLLYAMLHVDEGELGTYEFPDSDPPAEDDEGNVVVQPFELAEPITPIVETQRQAIDAGTVTVPRVVSPGPGWIVIHAAEAGASGPVIGQAAVNEGENIDITVQIDPDAATNTLYAMLHTDDGEVGTYEFPDGDAPVRDAQGDIVVEPFVVSNVGQPSAAGPSVTVSNQLIAEDGTVTVERVVSTGPGWVVIHADEDGAPGPVIGQAAVSAGENTAVAVEVDEDAATDTLYAMLHTDDGQVGTYEFPDGDAPVTDAQGNVVVEAFELAEPIIPVVEVQRQTITDGTVTIPRVVAPQDGWIVIHLPEGGAPGEVIGQAQVSEGENTDVVVEIDTENVGMTLFAMLHVDDGEAGTFEFPDGDGPVLNEQGDAVVEPFVVSVQ